MAVALFEEQKQAVEKLRPGSVLCGGVGTGKSRTAIAFYYQKICKGVYPHGRYKPKMMEPTPLYIITTARKRDTLEWEKELTLFNLSSHEGEGPVDIFVDSWNNIGKYVDVEDAFFIFDEQRLVGTGKWSKSFLKIAKKNRWILLTATPGDTWTDYASIFIANGYYKNITDFRNRHVIYHRYAKFPKIVGYRDTHRLERCRDSLIVHIDYEKTATQHHEWVKVGYDDELYSWVDKNRWNIYENNPLKNPSQYCSVIRKIVNTDPRRLAALDHILERHRKVIVFYNFDYELEMLRSYSEKTGIEKAEWNGHRHELVPDGKSWIYLVQYSAGAEGWNCIETDTMVFISQNYSYKMTVQACGRIDRLNTPFADLYYYHLFSDAPIDKAVKTCLKKKKDFNEVIFAGEMEFA